MITFFISTIGFIVINVVLAYVLKECILSVLPIAFSALTLILFALCLIRHLSWIDYFFVLMIVVVILTGCFLRKKLDWQKLKSIVLDPNNITIVGILLFVYIATQYRIASEWDELGVWALEVKTMFYTDGLSLPNMHTSIGYANYIPGQMLVEWWFCHLFPQQFNDNMMFFGYYAIYYFMIAHLLFIHRNIQSKWRNLICNLVMIPILFALPSCFCVHEYKMLSVELLISVVFFVLIYSLFDVRHYSKSYTKIRWIALSIFLVLLKMDAVLFLMLAYLAASILIHMDRRNAPCELNGNDRAPLQVREHLNYQTLLLGLAFSSITALVWQLAVRCNYRYGDFSTHRVLDNLKNIFTNITSGNAQPDEERIKYLNSFWETILHQPLHWNTTNLFDLTVISCVILIIVVLYLVYRNQGFRNGKREYITVSCIAIGSIVLFLLMLLFMYIYIFREDQYYSSDNMIKSLSRYAEPLFLGWSLTGLLVYLNSKKPKHGIIVLAFFLMCPSYIYVLDYFINLPSSMMEVRQIYWDDRKEFNEFFQETEDYFGTDGQGRILIVYGIETDYNKRQFRYLAAPRSVYWKQYEDTDTFDDKICYIANEEFCGFIYFEQIPKDFIQAYVNEHNLNPLGNYLYEIP